eukprot:NODE_39_length_35218_cov_0.479655.p29 type:complete len:189 gc:universal NODE_39_length_35218_cov_0.479655:2593-2027(-)
MGQQVQLEICIDVDFERYMTHKELKSLVDQVRTCYSANRKSKSNSKLIVAGCSPKIWNLLKIRDAKLWNIEYVELYKEPLNELILDADAIYLTADSENILETVDATKTYIIGGIVDRNRHKNLCKEKADKLNIQTARLPLADHVNLTTSSVLTINQVYSILLNFYLNGNWDFIQETIPQRKQIIEKKE